jgi:hypothetical protein
MGGKRTYRLKRTLGGSKGGLDHEDWIRISCVPHRPSRPRSGMNSIKLNSFEVGRIHVSYTSAFRMFLFERSEAATITSFSVFFNQDLPLL